MATHGNNNATNRRAANGHAFDLNLHCRDCPVRHRDRFNQKCVWVDPGAETVADDLLGLQGKDTQGVFDGERV